MSRIMVTGDSWSAGEWDPTLPPEETRAFAEKYSMSRYLRDLGHEVAHAANPGWGDFVSLSCLMSHEVGFDFVVYVKTCATRDFKHLTPEHHRAYTTTDLFEKINLVKELEYKILDQYKHKLILLGGIEKIEPDFNCYLKIPSITEFFYPDFVDTTIFGDYTHFEKYSDDDKRGAMKLWELWERKHNFWKEHPEHFASATDQVHPNRKATKALAEFIHNHIS